MANLIVCCDGTWNTDDQTDGNGLPIPTNVAKLYNALDRTGGNGQTSYYHPGVGTDPGFWSHFLGGTTGSGLLANVKNAYRWLATHYSPGDRMFLFGFSRGAYTARKLAGMIARLGLLDLRQYVEDPAIDTMINAFFEADRTDSVYKPPASVRYFDPADTTGRHPTEVYFVGVWDTVGSLGVPKGMPFLKLWDWPRSGQFRDQSLSPHVRHARHAVALDEKRANFLPTLWIPGERHLAAIKATKALSPHSDEGATAAAEPTPQVFAFTERNPDEASFEQVWFPGGHSDVGGGYAECGLSDGALKWMLDEAVALGLKIDTSVLPQLACQPLAPVHQTVIGYYIWLKTAQRPTPCLGKGSPASAQDKIHISVAERLTTPTLTNGPYWPTTVLQPGQSETVEISARKPWNYTGIYLLADGKYSFTAKGQWFDKKIVSGPDGVAKTSLIGQALRGGIGAIMYSLQWLYRLLPFGHDAEFLFTKRVHGANWFELVGTIANGTPGQHKGLADETFVIGSARSHKVHRSGYLYCFANDAWQMYFNNTGRITLTVTRIS